MQQRLFTEIAAAYDVRRFAKAAHDKLAGLAADKVPLRRGGLFLVNIGSPIIIGVATGQLRPTLIAAATGMIMSFADNDQKLLGRLRTLLDAAAIAAGGGAGFSPPRYTRYTGRSCPL